MTRNTRYSRPLNLAVSVARVHLVGLPPPLRSPSLDMTTTGIRNLKRPRELNSSDTEPSSPPKKKSRRGRDRVISGVHVQFAQRSGVDNLFLCQSGKRSDAGLEQVLRRCVPDPADYDALMELKCMNNGMCQRLPRARAHFTTANVLMSVSGRGSKYDVRGVEHYRSCQGR
jgi:hypothetical protein